MNIHEYQGKALLKHHGVPVLEGVHCTTVDQALAAYDQLGSKVVAVKSQIHAGGRGKGNLYAPDSGDLVMEGGVKIAFSKDDVKTYATNILGNVLVTIQTGDKGNSFATSTSNQAATLLTNTTLPFWLTGRTSRSSSWPPRRRHGHRARG